MISSKFSFIILFLFVLRSPAQIPTGAWTLPCASGVEKTQTYTPDTVTLIERFHQDAGCRDLSFEFTTAGNVAYPQNENIDFTYRQVFLTLHKELLTQDFNRREVCGFSNWQLHTAMEITGRACAIFNFNKTTKIPDNGEMKFGIYRLTADRLIYGRLTRENDGSGPQKRPVQFDEERVFYFFKSRF